MKKIFKLMLVIIPIFFLSGCWDQMLVKDARLILAAGFDRVNREDLLLSINTPILSSKSENQAETAEYIYATGFSPREARSNIDLKVGQKLDTSKIRVLTISSELAKKDIYPLLDVFYRDPRAALNAKIAIVEGKSFNILKNPLVSNRLISQVLMDLLTSAEDNTSIITEDIQSICAEMFEEGADFLIPYLIQLPENDEVKVGGMAMFHNSIYTGQYLSPDESRVLLLLKNKTGSNIPFSKKITINEKETFVSYRVKIHKSKINVKTKGNIIKVPLELSIEVTIDEFPEDHLGEDSKIKELNRILTELLQQDTIQVLNKLQKSNCDALEIGRRVKAFHYDYWKKIKWEDEFQNVQFQPTVKVEVVQSGVIN